ncbi:MAG TPA: signal peptidase I [Acidimicrobiia bacterium]|nr:signal peptidase I [Acidimicrobiia bacterium]
MTPTGQPDPDARPSGHETTLLDPGDHVDSTVPAGPAGGGGNGAGSGDVGGPAATPSRRDRTKRLIVEWVVLIVAALLIAFVIKTFLFQAFYIPSASMEPTLNIGDRVLVNKLSYDFHDVRRGDIVVFKAPPGERTAGIQDLVKRVIGLPGETVTERKDGDTYDIYINGRRLHEPYLPARASTGPEGSDVPPGCGTPATREPGCVVPKGRVFVLGDNRNQSKDARTFGPITESSIVGRVFVRIWPLSNLSFL